MSDSMQVIGRTFHLEFAPNAVYRLHFLAPSRVVVSVVADATHPAGVSSELGMTMTEIRPNVYMVTWIEPKSGRAATHVEDFERGIAYTNVMDAATKRVLKLMGRIKAVPFPSPNLQPDEARRAETAI